MFHVASSYSRITAHNPGALENFRHGNANLFTCLKLNLHVHVHNLLVPRVGP